MKKLFSFILITLIATFGIANANAQGNYYLSFDGVNDYVDFPLHSTSIDNFEIEIDITINGLPNENYVFYSNGYNNGYQLFHWETQTNKLTIHAPKVFLATAQETTLTIGQSYNVKFGRNSGTYFMTVNGVSQTLVQTGGTIGNAFTPTTGSYFNYQSTENERYHGQYNVSYLSFKESGTIVHEYLFNEGSGTTLNDSIGNNDGTIYGATWVPEGQYNILFTQDSLYNRDGEILSTNLWYRTNKIPIINNSVLPNQYWTVLHFWNNDTYMGHYSNPIGNLNDYWELFESYSLGVYNNIVPSGATHFSISTSRINIYPDQENPQYDFIEGQNLIVNYESPVQYPLSVNVDSNYGDYLDVDLTYVDNNENITDYFIDATIDSSSDAYSLSAPSTIEGFTFLHWFNLDTNTIHSTNNPTISGNVSEDINFRAIYTGVPTYNLNLNIESGIAGSLVYNADSVNGRTITRIGSTITEEVPEGTPFTITAPQAPSGFQFDGWFNTNTNQLFTTNLTWSTPFVSFDYVYEARYTEIPTYTFFANSTLPNPPNFEYEVNAGGTLSDYPVNITVNEGDDVYITAPTTNIGFYEFDGWYDNTTNNLISTNPTLFIYENIQQDISIQARYSLPTEYEVNLTLSSQIGDILFSVDGGAVIQAPSINQTLYQGQTFIAQAPSDDDYRFDGWFDLEIGSGQLYSTNPVIDEQSVSRDYILQARFSQEFTIIFSTEGGTPVNPIDAYDGDLVQAPIPPTREGFAFAGWNDSSTPFEIVSFPFVITQDTTFVAQWNPVYTISFNSNGGTQVDSILVSEGAIAPQPNDPTKFGYLFQGWFTDNQTFSNEYTFTQPVNSDIVLHANWEIGSDSDISQTLNTWVANSGISSLFIVLVILIAISVSLGIIGSNMFVIIISNISIIFVFTALGFIPLWIVLLTGLAVIGFIIMNVFGGRNG